VTRRSPAPEPPRLQLEIEPPRRRPDPPPPEKSRDPIVIEIGPNHQPDDTKSGVVIIDL